MWARHLDVSPTSPLLLERRLHVDDGVVFSGVASDGDVGCVSRTVNPVDWHVPVTPNVCACKHKKARI
jgi:hypothetical protein